MKEINMKDIEFNLHNVIVAHTSPPYYQMYRYFLLHGGRENFQDKYIVVDGFHCSCYDFDDTEWTAIEYTEEELKTLSTAYYKVNGDESAFWEQVRIQLGITLEGESE